MMVKRPIVSYGFQLAIISPSTVFLFFEASNSAHHLLRDNAIVRSADGAVDASASLTGALR